MSIRGLWRIRRGLKQVVDCWRGRAIVLLYHRIASHAIDPQLLCVSREHFGEHIEVLRRRYRVVTLQSLVSAVRTRNVPRRTVVVTFDDGYLDNLLNAKPLLKRYDIHATVFVTSGYVGRDIELPHDELQRMLLEAEKLPSKLTLTIGGEKREWDIDEKALENAAWNVMETAVPTARHRCYLDVHRLLREAGKEEREVVLSRLSEWAQCSRVARADRRVMTSAELCELCQDGSVEVGAHTTNHLVLSRQTVDAQWREIAESKRDLERVTGRKVASLAYPYGGVLDFTQVAKDVAREAGFTVACANVPGLVDGITDVFAIPRLLIRDWSSKEFERRLEDAFCG